MYFRFILIIMMFISLLNLWANDEHIKTKSELQISLRDTITTSLKNSGYKASEEDILHIEGILSPENLIKLAREIVPVVQEITEHTLISIPNFHLINNSIENSFFNEKAKEALDIAITKMNNIKLSKIQKNNFTNFFRDTFRHRNIFISFQDKNQITINVENLIYKLKDSVKSIEFPFRTLEIYLENIIIQELVRFSIDYENNSTFIQFSSKWDSGQRENATKIIEGIIMIYTGMVAEKFNLPVLIHQDLGVRDFMYSAKSPLDRILQMDDPLSTFQEAYRFVKFQFSEGGKERLIKILNEIPGDSMIFIDPSIYPNNRDTQSPRAYSPINIFLFNQLKNNSFYKSMLVDATLSYKNRVIDELEIKSKKSLVKNYLNSVTAHFVRIDNNSNIQINVYEISQKTEEVSKLIQLASLNELDSLNTEKRNTHAYIDGQFFQIYHFNDLKILYINIGNSFLEIIGQNLNTNRFLEILKITKLLKKESEEVQRNNCAHLFH